MSINSVNLTGRLTRDPDVRYTDGGTSIARFTLAVDRRFKQDGGPTADFPSCVAFGRTAEFIERYFRQGMKLELTGRSDWILYKQGRCKSIYNGCDRGAGRIRGEQEFVAGLWSPYGVWRRLRTRRWRRIYEYPRRD